LQQIPPSFTRFFNGILPCKVVLVDHDGIHWDVKMEKMEGMEGRLVLKMGGSNLSRKKI